MASEQATIESYRQQLIAMARRYKRYPRVALDNNWEGRAVVRLIVDASGGIESLQVVKGTGHAPLDRQALDMLRQAKNAVVVPDALRGRPFTLEIPIVFELKDAG